MCASSVACDRISSFLWWWRYKLQMPNDIPDGPEGVISQCVCNRFQRCHSTSCPRIFHHLYSSSTVHHPRSFLSVLQAADVYVRGAKCTIKNNAKDVFVSELTSMNSFPMQCLRLTNMVSITVSICKVQTIWSVEHLSNTKQTKSQHGSKCQWICLWFEALNQHNY